MYYNFAKIGKKDQAVLVEIKFQILLEHLVKTLFLQKQVVFINTTNYEKVFFNTHPPPQRKQLYISLFSVISCFRKVNGSVLHPYFLHH